MGPRSNIIMLAAEVMGAKAALIWFNTPHEEFENRTPFEILDVPDGVGKIERILLKMRDKHMWEMPYYD